MKKIFSLILACTMFAISSNAQKVVTNDNLIVNLTVPEEYKSASTAISKTSTITITKNGVDYDFAFNQSRDGKLVAINFTSSNSIGVQKINEYNLNQNSLKASAGGACKDCYNKCKIGGSDWGCLAACVLDNCMGW